MGSRGPLPKEEGKRQNRRARSNLKLIAQHDPSVVVVPEAPEGMAEAQLESWSEFWSSELSQLVKGTDMGAVRRLWSYYQQHEDLTRVFDRSRLVSGSQGQPRLNPALDGLMKLEGAILRLENELGLTPSARLRLGITFADATNSLDALARKFEVDDDEDLWNEG
jgi:P27 family predicted phage terminase small subunit